MCPAFDWSTLSHDSPGLIPHRPTSKPSGDGGGAYDDDVASDGYVNNLTRVWCWRPDIQTSLQTIRHDLVATSSISPRELAVMVAATASARGDSYCALAWGIRLAELSDEKTAGQLLRGQAADLSKREAALERWSRQVVLDPNATTDADVDRLRRAGLTDREIFEATAWIALRMAFSTVNDALGARPDGQLAESAPRIIREAVGYGRPPGSPTPNR